MTPQKICKKLLQAVKRFFLPEFTRSTILRMIAVAVSAVVIFGFIIRPCFINGESMLPTYRNGLVFCNLLRYRNQSPQRGDVVVISYFGRRYLLKRVVAFAGETVEFRNGKLFVDGILQPEPYVQYRCSWNMKPLTVSPQHCFVVGDNRSQSIRQHMFGEVKMDRIAGGLLF